MQHMRTEFLKATGHTRTQTDANVHAHVIWGGGPRLLKDLF